QTSSITLQGTAHAGFDDTTADGDPSVFDADGKVSFATLFDDIGAAFEGDLTGTISGVLPVFFPTDSHQIGAIRIGGSDSDGHFTASGSLLNLGDFEVWTDGETGTEDAVVIDVSDVVEAISSVDLSKLSIFDNIFLAVDGIDLLLKTLQNALGGLGSFELPLIGHG